MKIKYTLSLVSCLAFFSGCHLLTPQPTPPAKQTPAQAKTPNGVAKPDGLSTPDGVKITPYDRPEIQRDPLAVTVPVQHAQTQQFEDGNQLPAFRSLIQQIRSAAQQGQWPQVEKLAVDAQRLAPQAAEPFLYLSMVALNQQRLASAESLARRGLSFAQTDLVKQQLWQTLLKAGKQQGKNDVVQEATQHLN